ncbi:MAG TPA: right-handed parallel beta-helix repeat-containing protein [Thermoplasmata archaeon]|nr:right-handed parallel beta-helix repeat-containing protein [Thermoplasmata archaeon]
MTSHTPHPPILIQSNAEFTAANGVVGGHGTPDDPYLIAGWEITNVDTMQAIFIRDTDASFVIRDVFVHQPPGLGFAGIRFIEVSNGRVEDSGVTGFAWDLSLEFTSNLTVARNNLSHADLAVQVWYPNDTLPGVVVSNNNISGSQVGVSVSGGGGASIVGNLVSNNSYGIRVDASSNVSLAANSLSNNQFQGLLVTGSSNLTVESNDFSRNGAGLWLTESLNATLHGNTFDHDGLVVLGSSVPTRSSHSIDVDNLVNGKPIRYFKEESGLVVDGLDIGQLIVVDSTDVSIENVSTDHADVGLELANVQGASIRDSNFSYNDRGVFVTNSSDIVFAHDSVWFTNQTYLPSVPARGSGVHVASSRNVTVSLSDLSRNEGAALFVDRPSQSVTVSDSELVNNRVAIQVSSLAGLTMTGDRFDRNSEAIVVTDSKDVVVRDSDIERSVWSSAGFQSVTNLTVTGNRIAANLGSFCVRSTHILTVAHNTFESNEGPGLCLESSFDANITDNLFANNTAEGLQVYDSARIRTFRNAFADNYIYGGSQAYDSSPNPNTWDDGYPHGGNFWSNYRGADRCIGPGQDVCNGPDGIGDSPYAIQVRGTDRYPLMRPPGNDTVPPTVGITAPTDGATVNVSSIAVTGVAADSGGSGLQVVRVRVSGGGWYTAAGLADWTASAILASGINRIDAQAWDNAGNPSAIASVNVTFTAPPPPPPPTNTPPYANFSWTPASGDTSTVFTFTSTSFDSQDPPNLLQVRWDWESDGVWDTPWSQDAMAQHQFAVPGTYNVTMEAKDTGGLTGNQTATVIVTSVPPPPPPPTNTPPYANFSWSPASGDPSTVFTFTSTSFDAQDPPNLLQVRWDWESDGTWDTAWSTEATAQHQFAVLGTYNVTMEAKDTGGLTGNQTATVIVTPTPPPPPPPIFVGITATPTEGTMPLTVSFTSSVTGGVSPYSYDWEFGDGSKSNAANTVHIYITGGNFTVWLNVNDAVGTSVQSAFSFVNVTPAAVNLTVTPPTRFVEGSTGISVNFTASVTGGTPPYTYHWDFGDGGQSDAPNPAHTYATNGTYRVSVTVTDAQEQSVTRTFEFTVPLHSIPPGGGGSGLPSFVLAAAIAVAAAFAVLWWNERRRGRIPPGPPQR